MNISNKIPLDQIIPGKNHKIKIFHGKIHSIFKLNNIFNYLN